MIETTLKIDGMMCGMCEAHVSDVIRSKFKIKKVSASHSKGPNTFTLWISREQDSELLPT